MFFKLPAMHKVSVCKCAGRLSRLQTIFLSRPALIPADVVAPASLCVRLVKLLSLVLVKGASLGQCHCSKNLAMAKPSSAISAF